MKAILRKGAVACTAMLMGANVMAQENVFVEKTGVGLSVYQDFIPSELLSEGGSKMVVTLYEGSNDWDPFLGYQVINEDLEVEKEFKMYTPDESTNTRLEITEVIDETGNWVEISRRTMDIEPNYFNYLSETGEDCYGVISQILFNNDDSYEIIVPVYGGEIVNQWEGSNTRTIYKDCAITSLNVVSETGEILYTLEVGDNKYVRNSDDNNIVKIGNKTYLVLDIGDFSGFGGDDYYSQERESFRWYEICKETNSINFVREMRGAMNIAPTIADRDAQITITLNDENSNAARELIITGVNGQLVDRRDIPAGENTVTVSAAMMRSGMYNFTLQKKGEIVDNGKVIVK
ncbi:MAG: hypothetical protein J6S11_05315 [Bacteroidaceae bacterium]|nr:hypothetical protein [Bacteroidaceae bacterium]